MTSSKKTNLTKGAFYHHFPTKLDLGYALVDDVIKPMIIDRWITPLEKLENPLRGILKQMQLHLGAKLSDALKYGCPLNNLVQEMAAVDAGFKMRLEAALTLWIDEIEKLIKRAKTNGFLKKRCECSASGAVRRHGSRRFLRIIKGVNQPRMLRLYFRH